MIKTDILFNGYYGYLNTGDDAFVEVASWGAEEYWNKKNNRFLAIDSKLPKTIISSRGYPFSIPKSYNLQRKLLISNTSYLISAGGSTFHSVFPNNDSRKIALDYKEKGRKLKIGGIGISIGPFKSISDENYIKEYLKKMDFLALRDKRSFDFVNSIDGLPYSPINAFDLAALLPQIYGSNKTLDYLESKIIGISVCPYESIKKDGDLVNEKRRNESIIELIKDLSKDESIRFRFFIINGNTNSGDLKLTQEVISKSNINNFEIVKYNPDTKSVWDKINECACVISTRLHGAIFACFGKTPFVLVEYHKKCSDFLEDIGYNNNYRIFDAEFSLSRTKDQILSWVNDKNQFNSPGKMEEKILAAHKNFSQIIL